MLGVGHVPSPQRQAKAMTWTPELVQQLFDLGFVASKTSLSCTTKFSVPCFECPLQNNGKACVDRSFKNNPDLLTIIQTHFPEHLI